MRRFHRAALAAALLPLVVGRPAFATTRLGPVEISGNVSTQNLFRLQGGARTFSAFDPVQQRNTLRLQYEHRLVDRRRAPGVAVEIPFVERVDLLLYYRGVYDSIYDIAPGTRLRTQSGAPAGRIGDLRGGLRGDVAFENNLREAFVDVKTTGPVSFRIGRQQIVWGESLFVRALDSVNGLDVSWHPVEGGLFGKVGLDELRIPAWTVKMLVRLGDFGPVSESYLEAFDIPFDFEPTYARFEPAPWSAPLRNPLRPGLVVDGSLLGLPPGVASVQGCVDLTGNPDGNLAAALAGHAPDFRTTPTTGRCDSAGLPRSTVLRGLYDRRDPADVNAVGARFGANAAGIGFSLVYMYRRHLGADVPGATVLKAPFGRIGGDLLGKFLYLAAAPHETTDPILRKTTLVDGYLRVPAQFYYPYVHVAGFSANYFEPLSAAVYTAEAAVTHGLPIGQADLTHGNLVKRKDVLLGAVGFDRPTWIRWLNRRSTWTIVGQLGLNWIPDHEPLHRAGTIPGTSVANFAGDVGVPLTTLVPEFVDGNPRLDELKGLEVVSLLAAASFYRGGSVVPQIAWLSDWSYAPSMAFVLSLDYFVTNDLILTPGLSIFTNFGRTVDDAFGIGRLSQWDELKLKVTYQF